ncbi:uncharacterized protein ACR2FA_011449 [Aphomia sociella]
MSLKTKISLIPLLILYHEVIGTPRVDPLVDTNVGLIRGLKANDGAYSMFLGIPYATVDPEDPFGASQPHSGFSDIFEAYDDSAICPQIEEFNNTIVGNLDCLHLNIYVPNTASSRNRLPVLVWIYGGGFNIGFSGRYLYGPKYLVRHDIILVTINYRLGAYGFMCLDTPDIPGNQGLKDQVTALRWINNNIEAFGGDTSKITIFGESAGGASVDYHLLYSKEKLFNSAIMQSGTSLCPWAMEEPDREAPLKLAEHLGYSTNIADEALQFLATIDTNLVIAATNQLELRFRPCVEKIFDNVENLITVNPNEIELGNLNNIPFIIGFNDNEMYERYDDSNDLSNIFYQYITGSLNIENEDLIEMEEYVRHFYIGDEQINEDLKQNVTNFISDFYIVHPSVRSLQKYLNNEANIYHYVFSYDGGRNFVKHKNSVTAEGALHADEIGYLFDISYMNDNPTVKDQLVIDQLTTLWANFVKYNDPTPETTDLLPIKWPASTKETLFYLNIDGNMNVGKRPFHERMAFLDILFKLNKNHLKGYTVIQIHINYLIIKKKTMILKFILLLVIHNVLANMRIDPLVDTSVGLIRGLRANDGDYSMFLGIPYATVDPLNPFGMAIPKQPFSDIFEAYDDSSMCPQLNEFNNTIVGSLDCLHLNIHVPMSASSQNRLPVLVWIYGGGFNRGFAGKYIYGPKYLVRHDVILVTLNYRLGPYGFMCLGTPEIAGNQGLKDQLIALKWINKNIAAFGGDVNKITLFGESAGGASVDYHLLYSKEKLFHNVILQSGTSFCPWAITEPDRESPLKIAKHLGLETNITNEALQFLANVHTDLVISSMIELDLTATFKACVEKEYDNANNYITQHPINMNIENIKNVPVLIGYNNDEMLYQYGNEDRSFFTDRNLFEELLKSVFNFRNDYHKSMEDTVRHFYIGDEASTEKIQEKIRYFASDIRFVHPSERTIQNYIANGATTVFLYLFSYTGERNFYKKTFNITTGGASHLDEIGYLFDVSLLKGDSTPEDQLVIDRITTLWTNFAKHGNPTPELTDLLPIKWPAITKETRPYLNIDKDISIGKRHFNDRMAFWDLFFTLNKKCLVEYNGNEEAQMHICD